MPFQALRRIVLALILATGPAPALADEAATYQGVAGAARIVVTLSEADGDAYGTYFYESTRRDIDLRGKRRGPVLQLRSEITGDRLSLSRSGAGLSGQLTTAKGRTMAVSLQPAAPPLALPADAPSGDLSLYERLRLAGLALVRQEAATAGGRTIRWYREPKSGIRLFRLEAGYGAPAMATMNRELARQQWAEVSASLGCTASNGQPGTELSEADAPWLGAAYVSYVWRSSWDCAGAAHPDFGQAGHTFDARTGRELRLEDLLPTGGKPAPPQDTDAWYAYRGDVLAPAIVALLTRHHPQEMAKPKTEDDCDYSDPGVWDFPSWGVSEKGLWLGAVFPRVMRACDSPDWAVIPWRALPATSPGSGPPGRDRSAPPAPPRSAASGDRPSS